METDAEEKERKQRKRATVVVSVPGWPSQDPGRLMIWSIRPSIMKAKKEIKKLQKMMPEYVWSCEMLSYTQARAIKLKDFDARAMRKRNGESLKHQVWRSAPTKRLARRRK